MRALQAGFDERLTGLNAARDTFANLAARAQRHQRGGGFGAVLVFEWCLQRTKIISVHE
jgi:hypothetical protein